jgi:hypothetical protein
MRERLGHHAAARFLLEPIVSDGRCRVQAFFDISRIQFDVTGRGPSRLRRFVAPDAGITVGLQFHTH